MNVIVHYPKKAEDIRELKKRVAAIHSDMVLQHIQSIPCTKEQKQKLIEDIIKGSSPGR